MFLNALECLERAGGGGRLERVRGSNGSHGQELTGRRGSSRSVFRPTLVGGVSTITHAYKRLSELPFVFPGSLH